MATREVLDVDGVPISVLRAGQRGAPPALLLHGTFWNRVWDPVADVLGEVRDVLAPDLPGFGASGGRLGVDAASVPALAAWCGRFLAAAGVDGPYAVVGHDIGGGIAQHLAVHDDRVERLALVNGVLLDSWPVPAVERFRDPEVRAQTSVDDLLTARAKSLEGALARPPSDQEREAWLAPWHDEDRAESWMAMAAAADARFTLDLVPGLQERELHTVLVWGEDDAFQQVRFAERFLLEVPRTDLVRIAGARHVPTWDDPDAVSAALRAFLR